MRNWLIEITQWLAGRISRLMWSVGMATAEPKPPVIPLKSTSTAGEPVDPHVGSRVDLQIDFQASSLRKSRPIASSLTRQSITIPVTPRPRQNSDETVLSQTEIVKAEETVEVEEVEMAVSAADDITPFDTESVEAEFAGSEPTASEIDEPEFDTTELDTPEIDHTEVNHTEMTEADETSAVENPVDPPSEAAHALAELAAIQATQSEAIFTVVNAEDGAIEVQVRGETMSLGAALESLLFVADTSVEVKQFVKLFSLDVAVIEAALVNLAEYYKQSGRGIRLQEQGGRYRLISVPAAANLIETFLNLDLTTRLSGPALETLSVIAYRQPVTRAAIEAVRGVDCGYVLRSLLQRGLVEESGRLETVGRPILYSVTELFMQHFGLTNLHDLPPLETTEAALLMQVTEMEEEGLEDKGVDGKED